MNVIDNFFQSVVNLPIMPRVVQEVIQILNTEDVDIKKLVDTINHDQVISAKILRLSNSSYYGRSRKIQTIENAISLVGLNSLRTLVLACGVTGAFKEIPGFDLKKFWRHSLITASIARQICKELDIETETAYIAALMHSIGQLPIHIVFPKAGVDIEEMCKGLSVIERKAIENSTLGLDHCQVGEELAKRWNFPEEIQQAIRYYADPFNQEAGKLSPIIFMAAHIAFGLELGEDAVKIAQSLNPDVASVLSVNAEEWAHHIELYRDFVHEAENFI